MKPRIYLAQTNAIGDHGPGLKITIMARPRSWEHGSGRCHQLTPSLSLFDAVKAGRIGLADYKEHYTVVAMDKSQDGAFHPGSLCFVNTRGRTFDIEDGDTLFCACSKAAAARGECHRVWAAEILRENGWNVILDGKELSDATTN